MGAVWGAVATGCSRLGLAWGGPARPPEFCRSALIWQWPRRRLRRPGPESEEMIAVQLRRRPSAMVEYRRLRLRRGFWPETAASHCLKGHPNGCGARPQWQAAISAAVVPARAVDLTIKAPASVRREWTKIAN